MNQILRCLYRWPCCFLYHHTWHMYIIIWVSYVSFSDFFSYFLFLLPVSLFQFGKSFSFQVSGWNLKDEDLLRNQTDSLGPTGVSSITPIQLNPHDSLWISLTVDLLLDLCFIPEHTSLYSKHLDSIFDNRLSLTV